MRCFKLTIFPRKHTLFTLMNIYVKNERKLCDYLEIKTKKNMTHPKVCQSTFLLHNCHMS